MYVWSHTHHYYYHLEVKQEVVEGGGQNTHTHTQHTLQGPLQSWQKLGIIFATWADYSTLKKDHPGAKQEVEVEVLSRKNN